jgi:hypothetical protein
MGFARPGCAVEAAASVGHGLGRAGRRHRATGGHADCLCQRLLRGCDMYSHAAVRGLAGWPWLPSASSRSIVRFWLTKPVSIRLPSFDEESEANVQLLEERLTESFKQASFLRQ